MSELTVTVVDHPLAAERLRVLRDESTSNGRFRHALDELGSMLVYEATRDIPTIDAEVQTPLTMAPGRRIKTQPLLVPILRAGIGLLEPAFRLLPDASAGFVGLARDEETFEPKPYVNKLPERLDDKLCIVLDPMLATGGSLELACRLLLERGAPQPITVVCVLAAPEGIEHMRQTGIGMHIVTAAIDSHLNEHAFIVPGLGDAGDRQFGRPA